MDFHGIGEAMGSLITLVLFCVPVALAAFVALALILLGWAGAAACVIAAGIVGGGVLSYLVR